jgi:hypothetical protein
MVHGSLQGLLLPLVLFLLALLCWDLGIRLATVLVALGSREPLRSAQARALMAAATETTALAVGGIRCSQERSQEAHWHPASASGLLCLEFEMVFRLHALVLAALRPLVQVGVLQSDAAREFLLGHGQNEFRRLSVLKVRYARGGRPHPAGVDHVVGVDSVVMVVVNRIPVRSFW